MRPADADSFCAAGAGQLALAGQGRGVAEASGQICPYFLLGLGGCGIGRGEGCIVGLAARLAGNIGATVNAANKFGQLEDISLRSCFYIWHILCFVANMDRTGDQTMLRNHLTEYEFSLPKAS